MTKEAEMMKELDELLKTKIGRAEEEGYVRVVRCKDCEEFDKDDLKKGRKTAFCYMHGEFFNPEYFCADAKRRTK